MGANLKRADLRETYMEQVGLIGANLKDANLQNAVVRNAYLGVAMLKRANLEGADLRGTDLGVADMELANLKNATLEGASLFRTQLKKANLQNADLSDAILEETNLDKAVLIGADLSSVQYITPNQLRTAITSSETELPTYLDAAFYSQDRTPVAPGLTTVRLALPSDLTFIDLSSIIGDIEQVVFTCFRISRHDEFVSGNTFSGPITKAFENHNFAQQFLSQHADKRDDLFSFVRVSRIGHHPDTEIDLSIQPQKNPQEPLSGTLLLASIAITAELQKSSEVSTRLFHAIESNTDKSDIIKPIHNAPSDLDTNLMEHRNTHLLMIKDALQKMFNSISDDDACELADDIVTLSENRELHFVC
jgi:uncharacterized protein YjbI with pentapeptide repeats